MELALTLSALFAGAAWYFVPVAGPLEVTLAPSEVERHETKAPLVVSIGEDGTIFLLSRPVTRGELSAHLASIDDAERAVTRVFMRAHPRVAYGRTMEVMQLLTAAGFGNIALVPGGNGAAVERGFEVEAQRD